MELEEIFIPAWRFDSFAKDLMDKFPNNPPYSDMVEILKYTDGSMLPKLKTKVNGKRVYVAASPRSGDSTEIKRDQLYHMFKATGLVAKENGAKEVVGIMSEHFHDRSHREKENECVFAKQIAKEFKIAGFDKILTMAVHSKDLYEFYKNAYGTDGKDILYSLDPSLIQAHMFSNIIHEFKIKERGIIVGLDEGAKVWVEGHRNYLKPVLELEELYFKKKRADPNNPKSIISEISSKIDSLEDSVLLITDDKGDTLGTFFRTMENIQKMESGKPKYVFLAVPHALLNRTANKIIESLGVNLISSTSNPTIKEKEHIKRLPIFWYDSANYFYSAIEECVRNNKHPDEVFNSSYPLWAVQNLYEVVQRPQKLVKYKGDFSANAFL